MKGDYPKEHSTLLEYVAWEGIIPISFMIILSSFLFKLFLWTDMYLPQGITFSAIVNIIVILVMAGMVELMSMILTDILKVVMEKIIYEQVTKRSQNNR